MWGSSVQMGTPLVCAFFWRPALRLYRLSGVFGFRNSGIEVQGKGCRHFPTVCGPDAIDREPMLGVFGPIFDGCDVHHVGVVSVKEVGVDGVVSFGRGDPKVIRRDRIGP